MEINSGDVDNDQDRFCICMFDEKDNNNEENSKWIFCEGCRRWYHIKCVLLTEEEYENIMKSSEKWYCENHQCQSKRLENTKQTLLSQESNIELFPCSICEPN